MEAVRLRGEVMILKVAIEEAINKGQKSMGDLGDIPSSDLVSDKHFALIHMNVGSGVVGWVDDF